MAAGFPGTASPLQEVVDEILDVLSQDGTEDEMEADADRSR